MPHNLRNISHSPSQQIKMNLRLVLIAAKACIISSMVARAEEDYGFEIVSDIGHWLEMESTNIAFMPDRPFLRGSNYTVEDNFEVDYEWNSNATLIDYGNGDLDERKLAQLSVRDRQWLNSHNKRRRKYHNKFNKKYIPLKWSPKLKRSSKKWAKHLANQCGQGIYHDPKNNFGENLASNWGTGSWARKPSTESVLTRLVENEEGLNYPENGHFTRKILLVVMFSLFACPLNTLLHAILRGIMAWNFFRWMCRAYESFRVRQKMPCPSLSLRKAR